MKFEIDDKTGMIKRKLYGCKDTPSQYVELDGSYLEQILKAVKKTQEKILNIDIQTFQDSKNDGVISGVKEIKFTDGKLFVKDNKLIFKGSDNITHNLCLS